jgi:hypothetical protein
VRISLFICFSLFFDSVYSNDLINNKINKAFIEKTTSQLNQFYGNYLGPVQNPYCFEGAKNQMSSLQSCVESICGTNDSFQDYSEYVSDYIKNDKTNSDITNVVLKQDIEKYMESNLEYRINNLKGLLAQLNENKTTPNSKSVVLHKLSFIMSFMDELDYEVDGSNLNVIGLQNQGDVTLYREDQKKWVIDSINEIGLFKGNILESFNNPKKVLLERYPNSTIKEAVSKMSQEIISKNKAFKNKNNELISLAPSLFEDILNPKILNKVKDIDSLQESDLSDLVTAFWSINVVFPIIDSPESYPTINNYNYDIDEIIKQSSLKERIELEIKKLENKEILAQQKSEVLEKCLAAENSIGMMPDQSQIDAFHSSIPKAKEQLKAEVVSKYSLKTQKKLIKVIDDLSFSLPLPKNEYQNIFKEGVQEKTQEYILEAQKYKMNPNKNDRHLLELYEYIGTDKRESAYEELLETCNEFDVPLGLSDATNTITGKVMVSWQSIKFPKMGYGVLLHEMGHNIFASFRKNKNSSKGSFSDFKSTVSCLNESHPYLNNDSINSQEIELLNGEKGILPEGQYADEDFSDLVAGIAGGSDFQNYACHWIYKELNQIDENPPSIFNPISSDAVHSSTLFRLLHLKQSQDGSITSQCSNYFGYSFPIKSCKK